MPAARPRPADGSRRRRDRCWPTRSLGGRRAPPRRAGRGDWAAARRGRRGARAAAARYPPRPPSPLCGGAAGTRAGSCASPVPRAGSARATPSRRPGPTSVGPVRLGRLRAGAWARPQSGRFGSGDSEPAPGPVLSRAGSARATPNQRPGPTSVGPDPAPTRRRCHDGDSGPVSPGLFSKLIGSRRGLAGRRLPRAAKERGVRGSEARRTQRARRTRRARRTQRTRPVRLGAAVQPQRIPYGLVESIGNGRWSACKGLGFVSDRQRRRVGR